MGQDAIAGVVVFGVLVLVLVLIIAVSVRTWRVSKSAEDEYRRWALDRGFDYVDADPRIERLSQGFPLNKSGVPRFVSYGHYRGQSIVIGQWYYFSANRMRAGRNLHPVEVVAVALPRNMPYMDFTRPRGALQILNRAPGRARAKTDFAQAFTVTGPDGGFNRHVLASTVPDLLMSPVAASVFSFRIEGQWLMCFGDHDLHLPSVEWRLELLSRIAGALPG